MKKKQSFDFEFTIEGATSALAEAILDAIVAIVEAAGATMGGGFTESKEEGDGEETA